MKKVGVAAAIAAGARSSPRPPGLPAACHCSKSAPTRTRTLRPWTGARLPHKRGRARHVRVWLHDCLGLSGGDASRTAAPATLVGRLPRTPARPGPTAFSRGRPFSLAWCIRIRCTSGCSSSDGVNWSGLSRVPADPVGSGVDHFIPGLGVDRATSGSSAHLGLTYYFYPKAACTVSTCQLDAAFMFSTDGGATWSSAVPLAGPMTLTWLPLTSQGYMVGDYIATSFFSSGLALTTIAVATSGTAPDKLGEAIFAPSTTLAVAGGSTAAEHALSSDSSNIANLPTAINR